MPHSSEIVMIVPKLPPAIDGIGDYGFNLAKQLYQDFGWKTRFIVGTPESQDEIEGDFFQTTIVQTRSQTALLKLLPAPPATVLLQYAGHGYAKRGCPVWLVNALEQWCHSGGTLVTMFHELYATRPLLSSAILTQHLQRHLALQLMKFSDRILTNRSAYAEKICRFSKKQSLSMPVFSNVGECLAPKPFKTRSRNLVIFGSSNARQQIYQQSGFHLERICRELQIETIIDIGKELSIELNPLGMIPIQTFGVQCAEQISQVLNDAIAGVVCYPANYLAKSGIFAAYCSHGVLPIVVSKRVQEQDGLRVNQQYVLMQEALPNFPEAIATAAQTWYQSHSLRTQAHSFAQCLQALNLSLI
ncbi:glycosyltransferase family 1 protein [Pseudanabaenaceae cyanobacterium LEGE 13415]|nr:glycosyltransferase family 1 protein [Pseudanabaenaceae cyanobacterium LEGE 13415]